jgi:hypothetical protein
LRRRKSRRARIFRVALVLACGLGLVSLAAVSVRSLALGTGTPVALQLTRIAPSLGQVALTGAQAERRLGFVTVVGNVINRSRHTQPRVEAIVELLDGHDQTVQVESSLLPFDPLGVGESAPFRVELPDDAHAVAYRVRFKHFLGSRLD